MNEIVLQRGMTKMSLSNCNAIFCMGEKTYKVRYCTGHFTAGGNLHNNFWTGG
jgi:hypothetical protein